MHEVFRFQELCNNFYLITKFSILGHFPSRAANLLHWTKIPGIPGFPGTVVTLLHTYVIIIFMYELEFPKRKNSTNSITSCGGSSLGINGGIINNSLYRAVPSKRKRNPSTVKKHKKILSTSRLDGCLKVSQVSRTINGTPNKITPCVVVSLF